MSDKRGRSAGSRTLGRQTRPSCERARDVKRDVAYNGASLSGGLSQRDHLAVVVRSIQERRNAEEHRGLHAKERNDDLVDKTFKIGTKAAEVGDPNTQEFALQSSRWGGCKPASQYCEGEHADGVRSHSDRVATSRARTAASSSTTTSPDTPFKDCEVETRVGAR